MEMRPGRCFRQSSTLASSSDQRAAKDLPADRLRPFSLSPGRRWLRERTPASSPRPTCSAGPIAPPRAPLFHPIGRLRRRSRRRRGRSTHPWRHRASASEEMETYATRRLGGVNNGDDVHAVGPTVGGRGAPRRVRRAATSSTAASSNFQDQVHPMHPFFLAVLRA
jgi:hypothetical protein